MQKASVAASRLMAIALVVALGACSSGSALTTSSLFGSSSSKGTETAAAAPTPTTMTDRVLYVGTTAASAQRCGYVFNPLDLRQAYLAYESQQGGTPDALAKAEKSYDYTFASVTKSIVGDKDYCSEAQTAVIKRDLTNVLAGDYTPSRKAPSAGLGWWGSKKGEQPMNREKVFDPIN